MTSGLQQCPSCPLQLTDVYEIAEKVGEHFQQLISQFGPTHLTTLIPTVVGALEHLETSVQESHSLQISNRKLMLKNDNLAKEREERIKLSNEVEVGSSVCLSVSGILVCLYLPHFVCCVVEMAMCLYNIILYNLIIFIETIQHVDTVLYSSHIKGTKKFKIT